jgi:alpha-glucuronidase
VSDTTFEQARRCPASECKQPGKEVAKTELPQGGHVHTFECENLRCTRTGERWLVQTNPDGTIPQPHQGAKVFPKLNHFSQNAQRSRDYLRVLEYQSTHPELTVDEVIRALGG